MSKLKLAITIRSLNYNCQDFNRLNELFDIIYINDSGVRLSAEEVISTINGADAVIAGTEPFDKNVLDSSAQLKIISRIGVGLDNIDLKTANERGIKIYNTPNSPTVAVAEHTLALIFSLYKNIHFYCNKTNRNQQNVISGRLVTGKKVGIIGIGRIGFNVAELLSAAGCEIGYYDPYIGDKLIPEEWINYRSIEELLTKSDIVTFHMPPKNDGTPVIDNSNINFFKKGSILINTARSSLIDEDALLNAIDKGIISGAGLDVYDNIIEDQIQNYPQIILTPHVASNTIESRHEMEAEAINNLIKAITEN